VKVPLKVPRALWPDAFNEAPVVPLCKFENAAANCSWVVAPPDVKVNPPKVIVCPAAKATPVAKAVPPTAPVTVPVPKVTVADSVTEAVPSVTAMVGARPLPLDTKSVTFVLALAEVNRTVSLLVPVGAPVE